MPYYKVVAFVILCARHVDAQFMPLPQSYCVIALPVPGDTEH
jgi:hypothetical protein